MSIAITIVSPDPQSVGVEADRWKYCIDDVREDGERTLVGSVLIATLRQALLRLHREELPWRVTRFDGVVTLWSNEPLDVDTAKYVMKWEGQFTADAPGPWWPVDARPLPRFVDVGVWISEDGR